MGIHKCTSVKEKLTRYCAAMALAIVTTTAIDAAMAISGGFPDTLPWLVKVIGWEGEPAAAGVLCTGAAINEQIIITASHCKAKAVMYGNIQVPLYGAYGVAGTDIALLVRNTPRPLTQYARLWPGHAVEPQLFPAGTAGTGYGFDSNNREVQRRLTFNLKVYENTSHSMEVFYMNNANGVLDGGDSGAPLFIHGSLVGIVHGSANDPDDGSPVFIYHGVSPALERIAELDYQRKARALLANEE